MVIRSIKKIYSKINRNLSWNTFSNGSAVWLQPDLEICTTNSLALIHFLLAVPWRGKSYVACRERRTNLFTSIWSWCLSKFVNGISLSLCFAHQSICALLLNEWWHCFFWLIFTLLDIKFMFSISILQAPYVLLLLKFCNVALLYPHMHKLSIHLKCKKVLVKFLTCRDVIAHKVLGIWEG